MQERIIRCLRPAAAAVPGHDRGDDIDQLREAGDFNTVRIPQESKKHRADKQSVFKIIDVFKKRQSPVPFLPFPDLLVLLVGMIPDIPLIKGKVDLLFAVLLPFHRVTDGRNALDEVVHVHSASQEARCIPGRIAVIPVERYIINVLIAFVEHLQLPAAEGRHPRAG